MLKKGQECGPLCRLRYISTHKSREIVWNWDKTNINIASRLR